MAINFPDTPSNGDIFTSNGKKWIYGGGKWSSYGLALAPDVLKVDSANNRVGVNNLSPSVDLDVTGNAAVSGSLTVDGDLTISGNTTTLNTTELFIEDNKVTLNSGATGSATANAGIEVERGDDPNVEILWDESVDAWKVATDFTVDAGTLHVDSSNDRVGIGTATPASDLEVSSVTNSGTTTTEIRISANDSSSSWSTTNPYGQLSFWTADGSTGGPKVHAAVTATSANAPNHSSTLSLATDPDGGGLQDRLSITSSGNVGINDTSPSYKLDVNGDINSQTDVLVSGNSLPRGHIGDNFASSHTLTTSYTEVVRVNFTSPATNRWIRYDFRGILDNVQSGGRIITMRFQHSLDGGSTWSTEDYSWWLSYDTNDVRSLTQWRFFGTGGNTSIACRVLLAKSSGTTGNFYSNQLLVTDIGGY